MRLLVIEGALQGLGLKTAASLLRTIEVRSWHQIGAFAAILALRTTLGHVMAHEQRHLRRHEPRACRAGQAAGRNATRPEPAG